MQSSAYQFNQLEIVKIWLDVMKLSLNRLYTASIGFQCELKHKTVYVSLYDYYTF